MNYYNGTVFIVGGTRTGSNTGAVDNILISSDSLRTVSNTTALPAAMWQHVSFVYAGRLHAVTGNNNAGALITAHYSFPIRSNGTVGPASTVTVPTALRRYCAAGVVFNNAMLIIGGVTGSPLNDI